MALGIPQPRATLVARGLSRIETRDHPWEYRGLVVVYATRLWRHDNRDLCIQEPFYSALFGGRPEAPDPEALPRGAAVAVARLTDCYRCTAATARQVGTAEAAFGDFRPGRFALVIEDAIALDPVIPIRGACGHWTISRAESRSILDALGERLSRQHDMIEARHKESR